MLRSWRGAVGLGGLAAGVVMITGAFLPWVFTFAGLIGIPGVRGSNGRILAAAGVVIALAGLAHAVRGGRVSRWIVGLRRLPGHRVRRVPAPAARGQHAVAEHRHDGGRAQRPRPVGRRRRIGAGLRHHVPARLVPADPGPPGRRHPGLRAWAADLDSAGLRRGLQIALGGLWLADGALQLQPFMFGRGFANQILVPAYMGSPSGVTGPALAFTRLVLHAPAAWNTVFAVTQLLLGLGLLWRPSVRAALAASIGWALAVWWLGEGLRRRAERLRQPAHRGPRRRHPLRAAGPGGLARPGPEGGGGASRRARGGGQPAGAAAGARVAWLVLWGSFAYFILQPPAGHPAAAGHLRGPGVRGTGVGRRPWTAASPAPPGRTAWRVSIGLAVVFVAAGFGVFWPVTARAALALSVLAAGAIWVLGENFGGLATGQATDPNSGLLLILLAAAFWPLEPPPFPLIRARPGS